jgi:hypothetical protein
MRGSSSSAKRRPRPCSSRALARGARTASAESASSAARSPGERPAAAGGRSRSSRSWTTSAIPWLRGDLGVEVDERRGGVEVVDETRDEERLHLVAHERRPGRFERVPGGRCRLRPLERDDAPVLAGQGERQGAAGARARVVEGDRHADDGEHREPRPEVPSGRDVATLHPSRVRDKSGEGRAQVAGRERLGRRGRCGGGRADGVEVERELQAVGLGGACG